MTTIVGLTLLMVVLVASGAGLIRGGGSSRPGVLRHVVLAALVAAVLAFLAWMAVMVFVVGPSMRRM
jgi:hypothetical protein